MKGKSNGEQVSINGISEGNQFSPEDKSEGIQISIYEKSGGFQVGSSLNTPISEISVGNKGFQFDAEVYNRSIQADEQPLHDQDVQ